MLVALASHRASPGVTVAALGLAQLAPPAGWNDVLLVEADPDGGALRFLQPDLDPERTLLTFGIGARRGANDDLLDTHTQQLFPGRPQPRLLLAPDTGPQVARASEMAHDAVLAAGADEDRLVIVDCGRLSNVSAALFHQADRRLLLVGPTALEVLSLKALVDAYPDQAAHIELVLVGSDPYGPDDLASIGMPVAANLPADRKGAAALAGQEEMPVKKFVRNPLVKALTALVPAAPDHSAPALEAGEHVDDPDPDGPSVGDRPGGPEPDNDDEPAPLDDPDDDLAATRTGYSETPA